MSKTFDKTVRDVTFDLLRQLDMRVIFGNPGSTEQPFLQDFPQILNTYSDCKKLL
jgi:benzoylformate decarboxylase